VPTGFQEAAGMGGTNLVAGPGKLEAAAVARSGYRAMMRGKTVVVPGLVRKLSIQALRVAPRWLAARIARWQLEQHG
jgi:short-subunit dehydrogenase